MACFDHLHDPRHLVNIDVVNSLRISCSPTPFHAAVKAGEHDGLLEAGGGKGTKIGRGPKAIQGHGLGFWRSYGDVGFGIALAHERRRLRRERLCGPRLLTTEFRLGNGLFLNRPERNAGHAIKDKHQSVFGALRDSVDLPAVVFNGQENRRTGQILIQQIMVDDLVMPEAFAGVGIKGNQGVGKQIHPMTFSTIEIRLSRLGGDVNDAALLVERLTRPWHEAGGSFVGILRPGLVTHLTWSWDEMKDPSQLSSPHIKGTDSARSAEAADDQEIFMNHTRSVQANVGQAPCIKSGTKMNGTVLAEGTDGVTGFRIQRKQIVAHGGEQALVLAGFTLPVDKTALTPST